jgi:excisionase family DNA binding protein
MSERLLTADDVAARLGVTRAWVYGETRAGRIPYVQLGRYYRYRDESLDAWLRGIERGTVCRDKGNGAAPLATARPRHQETRP